MDLTSHDALRATGFRRRSGGVIRGTVIILKKPAGVCAVAILMSLGGASQPAAAGKIDGRSMTCDPALAARFTPRRPLLGRYEVCTDPRPIADVAPARWEVLALDPVDAFGAAGFYDRTALAHLYGGAHAAVARGWTDTAGRFESLTFISPYANAALTALEPGTLVIRWICDGGNAQCRMSNAR
jgi:hypothetical protein